MPPHGVSLDLQPAASPAEAAAARPAPASIRLTSLDGFRGATMLFMASEIMDIPRLARDFPQSATAAFLARMLDHREGVGVRPGI